MALKGCGVEVGCCGEAARPLPKPQGARSIGGVAQRWRSQGGVLKEELAGQKRGRFSRGREPHL